jgi:predicted CXXCH cytochrome family protein
MKQRYLSISLLFIVVVFAIPSLLMAQANYVGSDKCMSCHKTIYGMWKDTLHNKSQQVLTPNNDTIVVDWKGTVKIKAGDLPEAIVKLNKTPDGIYQASLIDVKNPTNQTTYNIARTYGGWGWKQRYQVKIGENYYILPIQWNQATSRWVPYNMQNWYGQDGTLKTPPVTTSFEMKCASCHNTGLALKKLNGGYESKYVELNTGCEKCHGPGSNHVKKPKAKGSIVNPKKMAYERAIEVCGQCHSRGVSFPGGSFDFPWNDKDNKPYKLGEPLANYYQQKPGIWGNPEAHARQHHQQWVDLLKSKHYKAQVACHDCHNPHGGPDQAQLVKADHNNTLCLSCHQKDKRFSSVAAIRNHTKHNYAPETTGSSKCSTCHMARTASSAEAGDIHSHDFKIIKPSVSFDMFNKDPKMALPNSCTGCHKDWGKGKEGYETGVMAYESLYGK